MSNNNDINKLFSCKICNKNYASNSSLWNHNKKFHTNIVTNCCSSVAEKTNSVAFCCGSVTVSSNSSKDIPPKYVCKFCNRIFNHRSNKFNHEKICKQKEKVINKSIDDNIDKKLEEFKKTIIDILQKEAKIHPKTLQKNNYVELKPLNLSENIFNSDETNFINNCVNNKIIKSNDNKFIVDINKNFMTFNDKPIAKQKIF